MARKVSRRRRALGGGGSGGRRRAMKGGSRGFWSKGHAMVLMLIVIGGIVTAGGMAYQSDELYLQDKNNTTTTFSTDLVAGSNQAMIITATDSRGEPISNEEVKVVLVDKNEDEYVLYEGYTGDSGSVEPIVEVPDEFNGTYGRMVITAGDEVIEKGVTVKTAAEAERAASRIIISTDKPIYQPEQVVHIRTLAFEGKELMASQRDVTVEVQDPDGNRIYRKVIRPNEFGVAAMDYPLSDQLPIGNYQITANLDDIAIANKTVVVKRYVLPRFKIDIDGARTWYTADETIEGTVKVDYFFGKHVQGQIDVEAKVYRGIWDTVFQDATTLDAQGQYKLSIPPVEYAAGLDLNEGNGYLELNMSVTDTGGHEESKSYMITIAKAPITIVLLSDTNLEGSDSTYTAICRFPTGVPVMDANVTFEVGADTFRTMTDDRGLATVTFRYNGQETIVVRVAKDQTVVEEEFELKASDGIKVVPDGYYYELGEVASFNILYKGDSMTSWAYYDVVANGFTMATGHLKLEDGKGTFKVAIDRSLSPAAEVRVYKIEPEMKVIRDSVAIAVEGLGGLEVQVLPDKQTYRPGGEVSIDFQVNDPEGNGAPSILGVNIVDLAVFELSERLVGLDEIFWALSDEYSEPTYQILDYVYKKSSYDLDYETTTEVPKSCDCYVVDVESTWSDHLKDSVSFRDANVERFWISMAILGIGGLLGLIFLSFRYKRVAVGLILVMMVASIGMTSIVVFLGEEGYDGGPGGQMAPEGGWDGGFEEEGMKKADNEQGGGAGGGWWGPGMFNDRTGIEDGIPPPSPAEGGEGSGSGTASKPDNVRDYFPETWYWNPILITDAYGRASIDLIAPDSITTWGVDAVASTKDAKFGAGETNITVFQDFFVEPDIPVSAVRNDTFPLRILIYNYLKTDEDVSVRLQSADWFELVEGGATQVKTVAAESVSSVIFTIRATKVGWNDVSVFASAGGWTDAIVKPMLVEPDGNMVETIINGQLEGDSEGIAVLELVPERVPLSENAYVKLQASVEAITIDGAEEYINYVSGCGEQSMSTLSIDILAYDAVMKAGGPSTEKLAEFETMVTQGIQHELTFLLEAKNGIGRGIVWFPSDRDVHPWLTSWGLITFQDAIDAGFLIDDKIITDMQDWLASQQEDDGSFDFPDWGIYETTNPILMSKKVATTAYILRALLYSGYDPTSSVVTKAASYIKANIKDQWDDPYTLSIALIGLEEADVEPQTRTEISARLHEVRDEDPTNRSSYWDSDTNMLSDGDDEVDDWGWRWRGGANTHTIETTGYAVMAQTEAGRRPDVDEGVKYLLEHRTGHGFFSTQDTVVAFQALSRAGQADVEDMEVSIFADGTEVDTLHIDASNKDLTMLVDLRPYLDRVDGSTEIRLISEGEGTLVYQVYLSQYLPWSEENMSSPEELELDVSYSTLDIKVDDTIKATLTMTYTGMASRLKMVLVELKAPVGFSFVTDDLDALVEAGTIDLYELGPGEALVYIQDIDRDTVVSFSYRLLCNEPVKASIQGVHAFDMYNPAVDTQLLPVEVLATA